LRQEAGVINISNENMPGYFLLLEMAFQAERLVSFVQQPLVHRAVWRMARKATLTHGLMLKNKWSALRGVALETRFVLAQESKAAAFKRLLNISPAAFDRHSHVRIVAIGTAHFSFQDRMTMRQLEACPHVKVTLETRFG
jgi:hypothetical protein